MDPKKERITTEKASSENKTKLSESQVNFIAGAGGFLLSKTISQPFDVAKIRMQIFPKRYKNLIHALKELYKDDGIRGLWRGMLINQLYGTWQGAIQFYLFGAVNGWLENYSYFYNNPGKKNFVNGYITGISCVYLTIPFEVVKTLVVARSKDDVKQSALQLGVRCIQNEGVTGLYKGAFSATMQIGPLIGIRFFVYNLGMDFLVEKLGTKKKSDLPVLLILPLAAGAGMISNTAVYPLDVVKHRMQSYGVHGTVTQSCKEFIGCFLKIARNEGLLSFYSGLTPNLIKTAISTSIAFCGFEKIKGLLL